MSELPEHVRDQVIAHCRSVLPDEGCGYLVGDLATGRVDRFVAITNSAPSPTRFVLDPHEQLEVERSLDATGDDVVGVAHSHPSGEPVPSSIDVADAAAFDPFGVLIHAVASPRTGEVRLYSIVDGEVTLR